MISRPKAVYIGYSVVNAFIALTALLYLWEVSSFRCRISDHGFPLCFYSLFLAIPVAAFVLWVMNRRCRKDHSRTTRVYFGVSRVLFALVWLASCAPVAIFVAIAQPWPLSLRQGPDTAYAKQGFEKLIGIPPPASVSAIYYRADEGWLDSGYRLRFTCHDPSVVIQIAQRLQLQESGEMKAGLGSRDVRWWSEKRQLKTLKCFAREKPGAYYWYLWYDPNSGIVWYEEFSV